MRNARQKLLICVPNERLFAKVAISRPQGIQTNNAAATREQPCSNGIVRAEKRQLQNNGKNIMFV